MLAERSGELAEAGKRESLLAFEQLEQELADQGTEPLSEEDTSEMQLERTSAALANATVVNPTQPSATTRHARPQLSSKMRPPQPKSDRLARVERDSLQAAAHRQKRKPVPATRDPRLSTTKTRTSTLGLPVTQTPVGTLTRYNFKTGTLERPKGGPPSAVKGSAAKSTSKRVQFAGQRQADQPAPRAHPIDTLRQPAAADSAAAGDSAAAAEAPPANVPNTSIFSFFTSATTGPAGTTRRPAPAPAAAAAAPPMDETAGFEPEATGAAVFYGDDDEEPASEASLTGSELHREVWVREIEDIIGEDRLRIMDVFKRFDRDHDGLLSRKEVYDGLIAAGIPLEPRQVNKLVDYMDKDQDGMIDFSEFSRGIHYHHHDHGTGPLAEHPMLHACPAKSPHVGCECLSHAGTNSAKSVVDKYGRPLHPVEPLHGDQPYKSPYLRSYKRRPLTNRMVEVEPEPEAVSPPWSPQASRAAAQPQQPAFSPVPAAVAPRTPTPSALEATPRAAQPSPAPHPSASRARAADGAGAADPLLDTQLRLMQMSMLQQQQLQQQQHDDELARARRRAAEVELAEIRDKAQRDAKRVRQDAQDHADQILHAAQADAQQRRATLQEELQAMRDAERGHLARQAEQHQAALRADRDAAARQSEEQLAALRAELKREREACDHDLDARRRAFDDELATKNRRAQVKRKKKRKKKKEEERRKKRRGEG